MAAALIRIAIRAGRLKLARDRFSFHWLLGILRLRRISSCPQLLRWRPHRGNGRGLETHHRASQRFNLATNSVQLCTDCRQGFVLGCAKVVQVTLLKK